MSSVCPEERGTKLGTTTSNNPNLKVCTATNFIGDGCAAVHSGAACRLPSDSSACISLSRFGNTVVSTLSIQTKYCCTECRWQHGPRDLTLPASSAIIFLLRASFSSTNREAAPIEPGWLGILLCSTAIPSENANANKIEGMDTLECCWVRYVAFF